MKYRIKIITFANGRKEYIAQKKRGFIWLNLGYDGDIYPVEFASSSRVGALQMIDKNHSGNAKRQTIEFEYINK